ncbi:MAG: class II aldolase/adducin family protein [Bdellovibrionales bacterium]|nr:class II aldolase/adducin family protein [Bdellovibrionales bacterium]
MSFSSDLPQQICDIHRQLYHLGFSVGNDGNSSARINPDEMWITPAGLEKSKLHPKQICRISIKDGKLLEGDCDPSTEWRMHAQIYIQNPYLQAIVHSHPPYAIACSLSEISLEEPILPEVIVSLGPVPTCAYTCPGTDEIANQVGSSLQEHKAVILERHGVVAAGLTLDHAFSDVQRVEHAARILLLAHSTGRQAKVLSATQHQELLKLKDSSQT